MNFAIDTFPEERFGLVTGSICTPLFPKRSAEVGQRNLAKKLANQMYFKFYDEVSTWQMEHGKMAESFAFNYYFDNFDNIELGKWRMDGHIGGSTDAEAETYGVDFKCPTSLEKWLDYMYEGISEQEYNQCQMYMHLSGKDLWKICAYLLETQFMSDNGLVYPVDHTRRMIVVDVHQNPAWVDKLYQNLPKVITMRNEFFETLKHQFDGN